MEKDPGRVRLLLLQKIREGRDPNYDLESVEDSDVDWMVLPREEFEAIKNTTLRALRAGGAAGAAASGA